MARQAQGALEKFTDLSSCSALGPGQGRSHVLTVGFQVQEKMALRAKPRPGPYDKAS